MTQRKMQFKIVEFSEAEEEVYWIFEIAIFNESVNKSWSFEQNSDVIAIFKIEFLRKQKLLDLELMSTTTLKHELKA